MWDFLFVCFSCLLYFYILYSLSFCLTNLFVCLFFCSFHITPSLSLICKCYPVQVSLSSAAHVGPSLSRAHSVSSRVPLSFQVGVAFGLSLGLDVFVFLCAKSACDFCMCMLDISQYCCMLRTPSMFAFRTS